MYSKMGGRGIPRICRGQPRNLANGAAEFGKICRGKLWALIISTGIAAETYDATCRFSRAIDGLFNSHIDRDRVGKNHDFYLKIIKIRFL